MIISFSFLVYPGVFETCGIKSLCFSHEGYQVTENQSFFGHQIIKSNHQIAKSPNHQIATSPHRQIAKSPWYH